MRQEKGLEGRIQTGRQEDQRVNGRRQWKGRVRGKGRDKQVGEIQGKGESGRDKGHSETRRPKGECWKSMGDLILILPFGIFRFLRDTIVSSEFLIIYIALHLIPLTINLKYDFFYFLHHPLASFVFFTTSALAVGS